MSALEAPTRRRFKRRRRGRLKRPHPALEAPDIFLYKR
jgi:hypothetical protein